jgi:6-pyruvoyltetrahydropterin/6-carboxytetrahydropterin synthase
MRQWAAASHCNLLHGYALGFRFTFAAEQLDARGWVVDFGSAGFGQIRDWLHATFDHTVLIAEDDPLRPELTRLAELGLAKVQLVPGTSCESLAQFVLEATQPIVALATKGRCWIAEVECCEHGANSATFRSRDSVLREISSEALSALVAAVS